MFKQLSARVGLVPCALVILLVSTLYALLTFSPTAKEHNRCSAVQKTGWWLDRAKLVWQPQGCTLHKYTALDTASCLRGSKNTVAFIGDSSIRNKFYAFARLVDPDFGNKQDKVHSDIRVSWPATNLTAAEFIWDPYLTSTFTQELLDGEGRYKGGGLKALVIGSGSWYLRNKGTSGGIATWKKAVDSVVSKVQASRDPGSKVHIADYIYLSPIPNVVPELLAEGRRETLDPDAIYWMNAYMKNLPISVFSSWDLMTLDIDKSQTADGLHYSLPLEDRAINLLMNAICNRKILSNTKSPFHTTCCFEYPRPNWFVQVFVVATVLLMPWLLFLKRGHAAVEYTGPKPGLIVFVCHKLSPSQKHLKHLFQFCAILLLMYINDRTPLFDKLHKHYIGWVFWLLFFAFVLAGAVTWAKDKPSGGSDTTFDGGFLNRHQTDEWKGWMQIIILLYHLMNASTVSYIYNPIRILVAMYLFMTGYGHFTYFYNKKDYGLKRLTSVLLRLNILATCLAFVMNTSYMDYYFAPLCSIWLLIVWATMRILPQLNYSKAVLAKIGVSALVFTIVNGSHLWPFALLRRIGVDWNQREWEFRFGLDIYITYVGMFMAFLKIRYSESLQAHRRWKQMKRWAVLLAVVGILWYLWFEVNQPNKRAYNRYQPYISAIPAISFVILRNSTEYLRTHSSGVFRFVGKISLETFIAQFHLFLAGDTKAILVLVDSRVWFINLFLTSVVFVALCYLLNTATGAIAGWLMTRNFGSSNEEGESIPMTELPVVSTASTRNVLDRLAANSSPSASQFRLLPKARLLLDSLAVRWVVGLAALVLLSHFY